MKKLLLLLFLTLISQLIFAQKGEEKLVRKAFDNYRSSILTDRGEDAVTYVDSNTIAYYNDILHSARTSDSLAVDSMNVLDKLMVLSIRYRTPKKDLKSFDGRSLLVYAIKEGMVGKSSVQNIEIGDVEMHGDVAKGYMMSYGEPSPLYFEFNKEDEAWKIDLTSIFSVSVVAFDRMIKESGQSENEYFEHILKLITGKDSLNPMWQPLK
jgi:hypothetical protein